jgi:hypothetical protein
MKTKALVLAILPLLAVISGCENTDPHPGTTAQIHGDAGVSMQSMNTSHISPDRPAN